MEEEDDTAAFVMMARYGRITIGANDKPIRSIISIAKALKLSMQKVSTLLGDYDGQLKRGVFKKIDWGELNAEEERRKNQKALLEGIKDQITSDDFLYGNIGYSLEERAAIITE